MTLADMINAWRLRHYDEQKLGMKWIEFTRSGLKKRMTGLFSHSQYWKNGLQGVYYTQDGQRVYVEKDHEWTRQVWLQGGVVICYNYKQPSSVRTSARHYKHFIHINDIYEELIQYAKTDSKFDLMLQHFTLIKNNPDKAHWRLLFNAKQPIDLELLGQGSGNEIDAVPSLAEAKDVLESCLAPTENQASDLISNPDEVDAESKSGIESRELPPLPSEDSEDDQTDDHGESLGLKLRVCIHVMHAQFQQPMNVMNYDSFNELFEWINTFEGKESHERGELLYSISFAVCALASNAYDLAKEAIEEPSLLLLVNKFNDAYDYYCLSMIAVQLKQFDLAEAYINRSIGILLEEPNEEIQGDIDIFRAYVEKNKNNENFASPVVFYSSEDKRLSLTQAADRNSKRLSARLINLTLQSSL